MTNRKSHPKHEEAPVLEKPAIVQRIAPPHDFSAWISSVNYLSLLTSWHLPVIAGCTETGIAALVA
jgi:hypothetical protein